MCAPATATYPDQDNQILEVNTPFLQAMGSLQYAATTTRPDITLAVNQISRRQSQPTINEWKAIKRILRYIRDKSDYAIAYSKEVNLGLSAFCDADYAGDTNTSKSTTGYILMYGGGPIALNLNLETKEPGIESHESRQ